MGYFVYILRSSRSGHFYIGYSADPQTRLEQHNLAKVTATRNRGPWELVHTEECADATAARRRERKLKSMKSRVYLESLISSAGLERPDEIGEVSGSSPLSPTI